MKIFQILEKNQFNTGSVHQMYQAAVGLRQRGHAVTIVSRPDATLEASSRQEGIDFCGLPLRSELDLKSIRALRALVLEKRPDVIHVHKGLSHTLALTATWRDPVAAFVVNRGVSFPLRPWNRGKYRTRRVDRIVTVCQQIKDVIVMTGRVAPDKVDVVYAGTDIALFDANRWSRNDFRDEKEIPRDRFLFMQVGVRDWKGWRELIDSFSDVHPRHPETHLALIAYKNAEDQAAIERYAAERSVARAVTAVEYRSDMARVMAAADCVVDASWAGTGITGTIREAMALTKPVIATDCGGNIELVSSPDLGWIVPAKNRPALTRAMLEVIEHPARAGAVGHNAMEHVRRGFSKMMRIDRLEKLYREIVASKRM
ncbi:MAG TPA: glycosyltransferase family 4 protein [Thermoanaerobaculia bacterium]